MTDRGNSDGHMVPAIQRVPEGRDKASFLTIVLNSTLGSLARVQIVPSKIVTIAVSVFCWTSL
jgi:hypothetical protein